MWVASLPLTDLNNRLVLLRSFHHYIAFLYSPADWFFAVNIFAGFTCGDHMKTMPVIGCTYNHEVNILVVDQLPPVFVEIRRPDSSFLLNIGSPAVENALINITKSNAFNFGVVEELAQVAESHSVTTDKPD